MAELFEHYEINRAPAWWSRLLRFLAGSIVLHTVVLGTILYVPTVRSMLDIANLFRDADYVDEEYARIAIRRGQVVMLDSKSGFHYPPGYFSIFKQPPASGSTNASTARPSPTPLERRPKPSPTVRPKPSPTPKAASTPAVSPTPLIASGTSTGAATEGTAADQKHEEELNKQAAEANIKRPRKINKKPFVDLLGEANQMRLKGELNLDGTLNMTVEADRNTDGTLSSVRVFSDGSNKTLERLGERFIQALSASKVLDFLEGTRHLRMTLRLDSSSISARLTTNMDTVERASQMATGYNGFLFIESLRKRGKPEYPIYQGTKISSDGKQVVLRFQMSRKLAGDLLSKQLPSG